MAEFVLVFPNTREVPIPYASDKATALIEAINTLHVWEDKPSIRIGAYTHTQTPIFANDKLYVLRMVRE